MRPVSRKYNLISLSLIIVGCEILFWVFALGSYYTLLADKEFRLENPGAVIWFGLIALLIFSFLYFSIRGNISLRRLSEAHLSGNITRGASNWRLGLKYFLARFALGFIVIALCNPQYGKSKVEAQAKGIELMIALDVSNSMLARDLSEKRTRLDVAKLAIERLTSKLHGDRLGIVVFAGSAFTQLPITSDYAATKLFLDGITPGMINNQGTAVSEGIEECLNAFDLENGVNKSIIIISDGENHEPQAIASAEAAAAANIQIHTIGMGTPKGTPIELYKNGKKIGVKKDGYGNTVITKLNEDFLQEVSSIGGGTYTRANKTNVGLGKLLDQLKEADKATLAKEEFLQYDDQFQVYLAIGIAFALAFLLIPINTNRNVELNLFGS